MHRFCMMLMKQYELSVLWSQRAMSRTWADKYRHGLLWLLRSHLSKVFTFTLLLQCWCNYVCSSACTQNNGLDKRYPVPSESFFRSREWPRQHKTQGEKREGGRRRGAKGWGGRNINETEWRKSTGRMWRCRCRMHERTCTGSGRGGEHKRKRVLQSGGETMWSSRRLKVNSREEWKCAVKWCWRQKPRTTRCNKNHRGYLRKRF